MSLIDLVFFGFLALFGLLGYRSGLLARLAALGGAVPGLLIAIRILPRIIERSADGVDADGISPMGPLGISAGVLIGGTLLGYLCGWVLGLMFRKLLPGAIRLGDRLAGMIVMAAIAGALLWLLLPVMEATPGWFSEQTRNSAAARFSRNYLPTQPDLISSVRSLLENLRQAS